MTDEVARTGAFVVAVVVLGGLGLSWCMPSVFAALSARFALPGMPDWPPVLWFFLGIPWLLFMIFAFLAHAFDVGLLGLIALIGSVWGFAIANLVCVVSLPTRVRKRVLDEHGHAVVTAALAGLPAQSTAESFGSMLEARLLELGMTSYALRRTIVKAVLAAPLHERTPTEIVRSCQVLYRRRAQTAWLVVVLGLVWSGAAMLTLGLGAHRLWPPHRPLSADAPQADDAGQVSATPRARGRGCREACDGPSQSRQARAARGPAPGA